MSDLYRHKAAGWRVFIGLAWLLAGAWASAATLPGPVVDTAWLAENLDHVVLLDVRKDLKSFEKKVKGKGGPVNPCGPGGKKAKAPVRGDGHIQGAVLVNFKKILGKYKHANGKEVLVMLPEKGKFERLMQKAGVHNDSLVVITGKGEKLPDVAFATRLYWTLKYFGFDNAAILDGGTVQWKLDKHKVAYGKAKRPAKGDFTATAERKEIRATLEEVVAITKGEGTAQLLDARCRPFYLGLTYHRRWETPESRGHIPTAKGFPARFLVDDAGPAATLYSATAIEKVAGLEGIDLTDTPTVTSCHTGVKASLAWFVLSEVLGNKDVRVYDGSMHEWSTTGQPVTRPLD
uniref:Thiosulfate/3-mercaptopyruvate sulfurtransferase n=1 Tax=Candidatus Kentrum eta TaxID=2126337 RepID=A0A450VEA5_9GAMM|nr:MAG: thiosulfate/3-mercaptopyruvate sulfurtransferase [Candidatus Kentron sp. H]VFK03403.1 MAG: thiosulfate/3-mercaptopyruvate sulfurtransferase [Candidatus Kentron sp. H]VFK06000.1 MAG: thiosulfate/3-mercaptopyruvate sulfurtransferase [Candidatus Kentron sp. H]